MPSGSDDSMRLTAEELREVLARAEEIERGTGRRRLYAILLGAAATAGAVIGSIITALGLD